MNIFTPETLPWAYAIGLLVMGFVLFYLEVFVIPGINIFGILGVVSLFTGIVYAYVRLGSGAALWLGAGTALATAALVWLVLRLGVWQRGVLRTAVDSRTRAVRTPRRATRKPHPNVVRTQGGRGLL